ncbi:MAG: LysE family translocator [Chloroflexales bacterium]|nr:LysE family translocator [Chloroflexales bacterium]
MPNLTSLTLFATTALVLLLIPGPVVLYTLARSINQGRRAGLISVVAVGVGDFCHVLMATAGLSAILLTSATAFNLVKYAGAAYLIYLGIRTLRTRDKAANVEHIVAASLSRIFSQGLIVSVLNPKTALFFLAFLPQFVDYSQGNAIIQILTLGTLFVLMGMATNSVYALASATASSWIKGNRAFQRGQKYFAGGAYIVLGVATAVSGSNKAT